MGSCVGKACWRSPRFKLAALGRGEPTGTWVPPVPAARVAVGSVGLATGSVGEGRGVTLVPAAAPAVPDAGGDGAGGGVTGVGRTRPGGGCPVGRAGCCWAAVEDAPPELVSSS